MDIIINVLVQIVNIAIFFWVVIHFAGKYIAKEVETKIEKEKKLADADAEYMRLMTDAEEQKQILLDEALEHKSRLVAEWKDLAEQEKEKILTEANREAKIIVEKAQQEAKRKARDLDAHFEEGVKTTSLALVKKLFADSKDVKESYLAGLVDEFTASHNN